MKDDEEEKPSRNMFKDEEENMMKTKLYYQYYDLINPNLVVSWIK